MTGTASLRTPPPPTARLVVGFDASAPSARAAALAIAIARARGGKVWLVFAHRPDPRRAEPRTEEEVRSPVHAAEGAMAVLTREARELGVELAPVVREGDPAGAILDVSREVAAGMIVVGTRGLGSAAKVLLGSVSARLVAEATIPVTVVP